MDGNSHSSYNVESFSEEEAAAGLIKIEQLERLVRLLDRSDVSELEVKYPGSVGPTRLVLRKAKAPENSEQQVGAQFIMSSTGTTPPPAVETKHTIVAPLVGTFHTWAKPKGGALVAVGDYVKAGQLVATIQSLNVINEVESTVAGWVIEILVQEGQPVEYGQSLMVIDSTEVP